jgi:hypothetical protein
MTSDHTPSASSIPISLFCNWAGGDPSELLNRPPIKNSGKKIPRIFLTFTDKMVAFLSNDCSHGKSKAFIKELMNYLKIDSYGTCLNNKAWEHSGNHAELLKKEIELYREYKFVIVFENVFAKDWVSEKVMAVLQVAIP